MAITTRWLVENDARFEEGRIKLKGGANISSSDGALTTIENIYDVLTILFTSVYQKVRKKTLTNCLRPPDKELINYRNYALQYFHLLELNYPEILRDYSKANYRKYAIKKRKAGNIFTLTDNLYTQLFTELL